MTQTQALLQIAERHGGTITPASVIAAARSPRSVLHKAFTWDDTKAARKWRILEAQRLIRSCRVTVESDGETRSTYAFIGISTDRTDASPNNPYRTASSLAEDADLVDIAVRDAMAQLKAIKERYEHLTQLSDIWAAIDAVQ